MLSQSAGYAASALAFIAAMGGKPVRVKAIAEACDIPQAYLAKIINVLAQAAGFDAARSGRRCRAGSAVARDRSARHLCCPG